MYFSASVFGFTHVPLKKYVHATILLCEVFIRVYSSYIAYLIMKGASKHSAQL